MSDKIEGLEPQKSNSVDNNALQELTECQEFLKAARTKYAKYMILYDCINSYIKDCDEMDETQDELKRKVHAITLEEGCDQILDDCSSFTLLGLPAQSQTELNYVEGIKLQEIISSLLNKKYKDISKTFLHITNKDVDEINVKSPELKLSVDDQILLDFKNSLVAEQNKYINNLSTLDKLLEEVAELRLTVLPDISQNKVRECQIRTNMSVLRTKITQHKVKVDIFMENNFSLHSYKGLMQDIKEQQKKCLSDIEHLKEMKEKYRQVSGKHFDDILKSYTHYKVGIEKKRLLLNLIK